MPTIRSKLLNGTDMNSFLLFVTFHLQDLYEVAIPFETTTLYLPFQVSKHEFSVGDVFEIVGGEA